MDHLSDDALMHKVRTGDPQKLGLLYERYKKRLFGFFYQMHKDAALAEDMVQNVFMRVLKHKNTYKMENKFVAWIFQIARNVNYDHYRKNNRRVNQVELDHANHTISGERDIDEQLVRNEKIDALHVAMSQLSSEKRELLVLSKFKELKYKEIGKIMGCSEGNARTKVHRALKELSGIFLELEKG